ncbi:MAG: hypothetical protein AB1449_12090, partial [Chloroflexota bacterium]
RHRSAQAELAILRSRDALVRSRTLLINHVRGTLKSFGARQPSRSRRTHPPPRHCSSFPTHAPSG